MPLLQDVAYPGHVELLTPAPGKGQVFCTDVPGLAARLVRPPDRETIDGTGPG